MRTSILIFALLLAGCASHQDVRIISATIPDAANNHHDLAALLTDPFCRATVFLFITTQCPIANSYAPEIQRITREYEPRGVTIHLVHCDHDITCEAAARHAKEYGLTAMVLLDHNHVLTDMLGATVTPEAAIVSPTGALLYLGRIDDRYVTPGTNREVITQHNLRDALEDVIAGRPVTTPRVAAVGCYISRD